MKFPPIREGEKRKRIAGKRRRQFSSLEDFSCVRVWWLFRFKRTTKRTFSESWISFSLSVKSVKTRTAFLPDLGSILPYFEGKKGGVLESQLGEKKQTTKIHHRFKASHYRERLLSDLTCTDSFIKHSLFTGPLLSCKHHSIDHKETTNAEGVCRCQKRRLPPWRFGKIPEWKKGKAVRESTEKASQKKDPNLRGLPLRASVRRRSRQSFHRARVRICRVRARSARRRRGDRVFSYIIYTKTCVLFVFNRAIVCFPRE